MHLLPPPPGYYTPLFFWQVQVIYQVHEVAVLAFSRSPLGRANTFSFIILLSTPRRARSVSPIPPCFLALAFPFFLSPLVSTSDVYLPNFPFDINSSWFPLYPSILSQLHYPTSFHLALLLFSPMQLHQLRLVTSFLACHCAIIYLATSIFSCLYLS